MAGRRRVRPSHGPVPNSVVSSLLKCREWTLSAHGTKPRLHSYGLKDLCCPHRVAKSINAMWSLCLIKPRIPQTNVVSFFHPVGRDQAAA